MTTENEALELEALWNEALGEYCKESHRTFDREKWTPMVKSTDELEALIQDSSSKFSKFRGSNARVWNLFGSTMRRLHGFGKVLQAGVQMSPFAPGSVIVEAALYLIRAGSGVSDTYDALEELFRKIDDTTDRLDEYLQGGIDRKLRRVIMSLLCSVLSVFNEAEKAIKRGRGREMLRRVAGRENKVQNALDNLNLVWQTEMGLITAKSYATVQRMEKSADTETNRSLLNRTLAVDVALDMERRHAAIEESRLAESGNWLLNEPLFNRWISREFPVLWILGNPGVGKSYLASRVISHLMELHRRRHTQAVAGFFYITEAMQTQYSPSTVLTSIAYQITKIYDSFTSHALSVCNNSDNLLSQGLIWKKLFLDFFYHESSSPLFIVIDGLDEALLDHQELLIKMAKDLSDLRSRSQFPLIQILLFGPGRRDARSLSISCPPSPK
jgi:hypothetical protein